MDTCDFEVEVINDEIVIRPPHNMTVDDLCEEIKLRYGHYPGEVIKDETGRLIGIFTNDNKIDPSLLPIPRDDIQTNKDGIILGFGEPDSNEVKMAEWAQGIIKQQILKRRLQNALYEKQKKLTGDRKCNYQIQKQPDLLNE